MAEEMDYIATEESNIVDEINFIETNAEEIANRLIEFFEEYLEESLYPGDERREFLQGFAYILTNVENHINETGRGNLLRYATGNQLDALGDLFSNARLNGSPAVTEMEFSISQAQSSDIIIPQGTRVTPDGEHIFETDEALIFPANDTTLTRTVGATAIEVGEGYNGFIAGQINKLVESNSYVQGVKNTTATSGGTDAETDEDYKERLRVSPFSFAVAGPSESYRAIALAVSTDIEDVYVYSSSAGVVDIVFTKTGGEIPEADDPLLEQILEACSAKTVRPLTDNVKVAPATAVSTEVNIQYFVPNGDLSIVAAVTQAVEEYKEWQTSKIGRDINPDKLNQLVMAAGAARAVIVSPVYTELNENEVAKFESTTVSYGGSVKV